MTKQIFVCGCEKDGKIGRESVENLKKILEEKKISYTYIEDMCGSLHKNPDDLEGLFQAKDAIVFGCQSRAMQHLVENANRAVADAHSEYYHVDDEQNSELIDTIESGKGEALRIKYADSWKPWYPVIDYERCNGCRKCLNFCLFSVYSVEDDGSVVVSASANCKDMCPACARVCPQNAIIFPKHAGSPIDGGDEESGDQNHDILEQIQNDDVYSVLSARRKNFQLSLLKKDQLKMAEEERKSCSSKNEQKDEKSCDCDCDCNGDSDCNCKENTEGKCDCNCNC